MFGEIQESPNGCARNHVPNRILTRRNGIDVPVFAAVGRHGVTSNLCICSPRFPIGPHVNPVFGSVAVKEVDDQWALELLVGGHRDHVKEDLCALVLDVRPYILDSERGIGCCRSAIGHLNRIGKAKVDQASSRAQCVELPVAPYDAIVSIGCQEAGNTPDAVEIRTQSVTLNVSHNPRGIRIGKCGSD